MKFLKTMKKSKRILQCIGFMVMGLAFTSCHEHTYGNWKTKVEPGCISDGVQIRICKECGQEESRSIAAKGHSGEWKLYIEPTCTTEGTERRLCDDCNEYDTRSIAAKGHSFGNWITDDPNYQYRVCSECSFREVQKFGEVPNENSYGGYGNFDLFLRDCETKNNRAEYNGISNNIEINLVSGSSSCNGYTIVIPQYVKTVRFVGEKQGNPYSNLRIEIATRSSDIDVYFVDVRIESHSTILSSETRNINFNMFMMGDVCSFVVIGSGETGYKGANASGFSDGKTGGTGGRGADAFYINGTCVIECSAKRLEIKGQDGGTGGQGGSHNGLGHSGNGGQGGNGGNAINGEKQAVVNASEECIISIRGGNGGKGGSGRSEGAPGNFGASGCIINQTSSN